MKALGVSIDAATSGAPSPCGPLLNAPQMENPQRTAHCQSATSNQTVPPMWDQLHGIYSQSTNPSVVQQKMLLFELSTFAQSRSSASRHRGDGGAACRRRFA